MMTFKEKHLLPFVLTAAVTMGCGEAKVPALKDKYADNRGLLDERPQNDVDKYNTKVVLYQVDVPVYNKYGNRIEGQSVLTRGLKKSSYVSPQRVEDMPVKGVYLNRFDKLIYVKADINNAIYTENGFSGLFIDYNNKAAVIVADENVNQFINETEERKASRRARNEQRRNGVNRNDSLVNKPSIRKNKTDNDSLDIDFEYKDTVEADTLSMKNTFSDKQFLDTLHSIKQKEF